MGETDSGTLRIGDADRDQIAEVLSEHAAEGRLSMDELDHRIGVLYGAETRAQAAAVVADLPALVSSEVSDRVTFGHERAGVVPELPAWISSQQPVGPGVADVPVSSAMGAPAESLVRPREDRAAMRRRAKLRQDENAIGHTFQATRRAIGAELESATSSQRADEVRSLRERLRKAQASATAARQAVAAGDRAEVQRRLAELRALR
ncbi:MAG: DUF1707 SHOCT-like domain-containing protein [Solirubrobacteraceae bacterium]